MKQTNKCFWCGGKDFTVIAKRSDDIEVISCSKCDLIQVATSPDDLEEYYDENYYTPEHTTDEVGYDDHYSLMNPLFLAWESALINMISEPNKKYSLLDVGCATGNLMEIINQYSPNIDTKGIDISDYAVQHCKKKGLQAEKAFINKYHSSGFDFVISLETLEHLDNLKVFTDGIKRNLKRDGAFLFYVPSVARAEIEDTTRVDLRLRTNLEHLIYFTPEFFNTQFPKYFGKNVVVQEIVTRYGRSIVGIVTDNIIISNKFKQAFDYLHGSGPTGAQLKSLNHEYLKSLILFSAKFYPPGVTQKLLDVFTKRRMVPEAEKQFTKAVIHYHNGHLAQANQALIAYYSENPQDLIALKIMLSNALSYNKILLDEGEQLRGLIANLGIFEKELSGYKKSRLIRNAIRTQKIAKRLREIRKKQ